jgi:acyl-homoserine-lactone acylase
MDTFAENMRGIYATRLLNGHAGFTFEKLRAAAFDTYLPAFAELIPPLLEAYDALPKTDPRTGALRSQIAALRAWDDRWGGALGGDTLAVYWGDALRDSVRRQEDELQTTYDRMRYAAPSEKLAALTRASLRLDSDFGTWRTPWGEVNRFQRLDDAVDARFDDSEPSIPVPFTSGFGARSQPFPPRRRRRSADMASRGIVSSPWSSSAIECAHVR